MRLTKTGGAVDLNNPQDVANFIERGGGVALRLDGAPVTEILHFSLSPDPASYVINGVPLMEALGAAATGSYVRIDPEFQQYAEHAMHPTVYATSNDPPAGVSLAPYTAAPIPDNAGPTIGPQSWTTAAPEDALSPGPQVLTNGVDTVTESTLEGITRRLETGYQVLRPSGHPAYTQMFLGGYLVDGNPLNVLTGGPWLPEQWDAIAPAIQAGQVPSPTILPVDFTAGVFDSESFSKYALPATAIAAAAILWSWLKKRKGSA